MKLSAEFMWLIPLSMGIGVAMSVQTALNRQLREYLYSPLQAALLSFLIGTILLTILVVFQNVSKPSLQQLLNLPWYLTLGGCLGVYAISMSIFMVPKLGLLSLSGLIIFAQIVTALLLDHFGILGTEKITLSWQRLLGSVVIFIGVLLTLQR